MRPAGLNTKIFLDSGDVAETKAAIELLGFLDGQTTNPTLVARNPDVQLRLEKGQKFTEEEIYDFYKNVVSEISELLPEGSISIEVYSNSDTTVDAMFEQSKEMNSWIPNAHIKYPTTEAGIFAAKRSIEAGMRVNMTLCFAQEQAAAIHAATKGAGHGNVFVSPFIGRLDDKGLNGMDLIRNILKMYRDVDSHTEVLTASVRTFDHFMAAMHVSSDIITAPFEILKEWEYKGMPVPGDDFVYAPDGLAPIEYMELDLGQEWTCFDIKHELTEVGIQKFTQDWCSLIQ